MKKVKELRCDVNAIQVRDEQSLFLLDPMPKGYEQYYGFTQFALELNEMDPLLKSLLPPTDTRFRPDQR